MMVRQPTDDPRTVLYGKCRGAWLKWDQCEVRLLDGPFAGYLHTAGQAMEAFQDGEEVVLRGAHWYPA